MKTTYKGYTVEAGTFGYRCDGVTMADLPSLKRIIDGWVADQRYEAHCESQESMRTERDYQ